MSSSCVESSVSRPHRIVTGVSPWEVVGYRRVAEGAYDCGRADYVTLTVYQRRVVEIRDFTDGQYPPWEEISSEVETKEE
jgi:hypothetical protein